jgi:GTPase SAR1 family protein
MLIGNKCDLQNLRGVSLEEGKAFAASKKMAFLETSALDSTNVETAFERILESIYKNKQAAPKFGGSDDTENVGKGKSIAQTE